MADDDTWLPAGMRNNNPLNIQYTPNASYDGLLGPSQNLDQGTPQAVFQTPQHGMNAGADLLLRKYSDGMTSANSIIAGNMGWTPGNKDAAANVAKSLGVDPNEDLNLRDPQRLAAFTRALATQEQGAASKAYGSEIHDAAANHALRGRQPMGYPQFQIGNTGGLLPPGGDASTFATLPMPAPAMQPPPPAAGFGAAMPQAEQPEQPGFFGGLRNIAGAVDRRLSDPAMQYQLNILGSGLAGKDLGTAQATAAQAQAAITKNQIEQQRIRAWARLYGQQEAQTPAGMGAMQQPATALAPGGQSGGQPSAAPTAAATWDSIPPDIKRIIGVLGPDDGSKVLAALVTHPHYQANSVTGEMFDAHTGAPIPNASLPPGVTRKQAEEGTAVMDQTGRALYAVQQLKGVLGDTGQVDQHGIPIATPSAGVRHAIGSQPDIELWQQFKGGLGFGSQSQDARNQIQQYASTVQNYLQRLEGIGGQATDAKLKSLGEQINSITKASSPQEALKLVHNLEAELQTLRQNYGPRQIHGAPGIFAQANPNGQPMPPAAPAPGQPQGTMPQGMSAWPAPGSAGQPQPPQAPGMGMPQRPQRPGAPPAGQPQPQGSLPRVNSDADYASLQPGQHYIAPDGNIRQKASALSPEEELNYRVIGGY